MIGMNATTGASFEDRSFAMPAWKSIAGHIAAVLTALIMLAPGLAKLIVPYPVQTMFEQLLIPAQVSMAAVLLVGIAETFAGLLVLVPRYRRLGAWLTVALLASYMIYIGARYQALVGRDCSCFPWLKRSVNVWFFPEDAALMAIALLAVWWSQKPAFKLRVPAMLLAASVVFAGASFAYNTAHQSGIEVPPTITVDGKPYNLREGNVFLFFYDPHCSHCEEAARNMSTYRWKKDVTVIGLPTVDPVLAESFLHDTKLSALTSTDSATLRKLFTFTSPPYGVALDRGRVKSILTHFDAPEPQPSLQQAGFVD
jgi:uncharacterized membrane protein YphA (DoxX/SURF4 family)